MQYFLYFFIYHGKIITIHTWVNGKVFRPKILFPYFQNPMLAALKTPPFFLNDILVVPFTYKTKPMHKIQTYIKMWVFHHYCMFRHVCAILSDFVYKI